MNKPVILYPNAFLRQMSYPIDKVDDGTRHLIVDLVDTMLAAGASGISAPQLGLAFRLIVVNKTTSNTDDHIVMINPELVETGAMISELNEGCLSFPGTWVKVKRPTLIKVSYIGLDGQPEEVSAYDMYAQTLMHELDHLEGKLLIDHASAWDREKIDNRSRKKDGKAILYGGSMLP